jgi:hypothetical protein
VVSTAAAPVSSIKDVAGDQGGQVRLSFGRSPLDYLGSGAPVTGYQVYRRSIIAAPAARAVSPDHAQLAGWDFLATVPATTEDVYQVVVPTLADSNTTGFHRAVLFVRAATATPGVFYDSPADSGWSVDNLPPVAPAPFTAAFTAGATHLHWGANSETDLWYYRVYRGTSSGFIPGPSNLVATRSDTGYVDVGPAAGYYKLSATDVNGNESAFTLVTPAGTLAVTDGPSLSFALQGVRPNPSRGQRLSVEYSLPSAGAARLQLLDVSGRQVMKLEVGALGAGQHTVALDAGRVLPPGLYLVRLTQGVNDRVARVVVVE